MTPPILRPYQLRTVEQTAQAARDGAKVIVIQLSTGAGKTTVMCEIARRAVDKGKKVVGIVHRRSLVEQFSGRLDEFGIDHGVVMRGHVMERSSNVQICSKDTVLSRSFRNDWMSLPPADLVFFDECRHVPFSAEYRKISDHYRNNGAVIVGVDATPVTPEGKGLAPWAESLVIGAKTSELIKGGYVLPLKCFTPDWKKKGRQRRRIAGNLVESWKDYGRDLPTVLFTSRVHHSKEACEAYNAAGIPAVHVDATTPDEDRDQFFKDMETGKYKILCSVGVISEGVDVPCLGCAQVYMEPNSITALFQRVGRVMRPHAGQKEAVFIDHSAACYYVGFPDEDIDWTLDGNVDANFADKKKKGLTAKANYCVACELWYKDDLQCPQCGRAPGPKPKSLFAPPSVQSSNELLVEAERGAPRSDFSQEEKKRHWLRCLAVAKSRSGTFGMAAQIYKTKYKEWPGEDFPCFAPLDGSYYGADWKAKVSDVYPNFGKMAKEMEPNLWNQQP